MNHRLGLIREETLLQQFGFALATFVKGEPGRCLDRVYSSERRDHSALCLFSPRASACKDRGVGFGFTELVVPFTRLARAFAFGKEFADEAHRASQQVPFNNLVDDACLMRFACLDRLTKSAHLDGLCDAGKTGQSLGAGGSRNYPEFDFRLSDLCGRRSNAIVKSHRDFKPAAKRGSVD